MQPANCEFGEVDRAGSGSNRRPAIIYLVNQYPAISHTFIKREVLALERMSYKIIRVAVRAGKGLVDSSDVEEEERTTYLLAHPFSLLRAAAQLLLLRPRHFGKALATAVRLMHRSDRGPFFHMMYFVEACGLAAIVRASGARHIHAHFGTNPAEVALIASQLSGVTYSFTVHGCDEYDKPEFLALSTKIRHAAFVVAVSFYGRSQLYRWCDKQDRSKISLIHCGIDREFRSEAEDAQSGPARFLCVGRLCRLKGQDLLIRAAASMAGAGHKFEVVIVGDGEDRAELEALISDLEMSGTVHLVGWKSATEVRQEMLAARALIVASLAENLPVVVMEAMAMSRPVIAPQISGIPELVSHRETGWLVPPGSVNALAAAMTECLSSSREKLRLMGQRGRERVLALHDVDRETAVLADLFEEHALRNRKNDQRAASRTRGTEVTSLASAQTLPSVNQKNH